MNKSPVLFDEVTCLNEKKIGLITLNVPEKLNALSLPMIQLMLPKMKAWQCDNQIALVIIQGAGDRAFCAGGDIVSLYSDMVENPEQYTPQIESFFTQEYQLDYLIHTYQKPCLVWGSGFVMGGGVGLMVGASHKVVTETTKIAMPEIAIGLYPDVGASWFLSHMPENIGLFMGMTGAMINAADAKQLDLATHFILEEQQLNILDALVAVSWGDTVALNHEKLSTVLGEFERHSVFKMPSSLLREHQSIINDVMNKDNVVDIAQAIIDLESESEWIKKAQHSLSQGSPYSAHIVYRQLIEAKNLSLADCFRLELNLSLRCAQNGEFSEGVRALLVDKDKAPKWQCKSVSEVRAETMDWFFEPIFSATEHPLRDLGIN